jgi:hypothetical protein
VVKNKTTKRSRKRARGGSNRGYTNTRGYDRGTGMSGRPGDPTAGSKLILTKNIFSSDTVVIPLRYMIPLQGLAAAGQTLGSVRYSNNAYDVDSALGSTSMAGFAEWAAIYSKFRVLEMDYDFTFMNDEAFPVQVLSGFSCTSVASTALGMNYGENPYFKTAFCSPSGGQNRARLRGHVRIADIAGTKQALFDDLYTGSTTSSTLSTNGTIYLYAGVGSAGTMFTAASCAVGGFVTLLCQFYRRNMLTT